MCAWLQVNAECFASPLNWQTGLYCSAFGDVDKWFGSQGSFFDFMPTREGSFEVKHTVVHVGTPLAASASHPVITSHSDVLSSNSDSLCIQYQGSYGYGLLPPPLLLLLPLSCFAGEPSLHDPQRGGGRSLA